MPPPDLPPDADCPAPKWMCVIEEDAADYLELAAKLTRSVRTGSGSTIGEVVDWHSLQPDPIVRFRKHPPSDRTAHSGGTFHPSVTT